MKQLVVFLFIFSVTHCFGQDDSNVYRLHFKGIDSTVINMSDFAGKQILVVEFETSAPDRKYLLSLDSLYKSRSNSLQVIGVPVNNSDTATQKSDLVNLFRDSLEISFIITDISKAKKSSNNNQHALLKWLTNVSSNRHFDNDIEDNGRMFVISRRGILYASLGRLTILNGRTMQQILENEPLTDNNGSN